MTRVPFVHLRPIHDNIIYDNNVPELYNIYDAGNIYIYTSNIGIR